MNDLQRYLRAAECVAEQSGEDTLDVYIARAPSNEQARREVAIYLQVNPPAQMAPQPTLSRQRTAHEVATPVPRRSANARS